MKTILFLLLFAMNPALMMGVVDEVVDSCTSYYEYGVVETLSHEVEVSRYTTNAYAGGRMTTSGAITVCRADVKIGTLTGTMAANHEFYLIITDISSGNISTEVGRSDKFEGTDLTADTWEEFTFSTPVSLNAATNYLYAIQRDNDGDTGDGSDNHTTIYFAWEYDDESDSGTFALSKYTWNTGGTQTAVDFNDNLGIKFYTE